MFTAPFLLNELSFHFVFYLINLIQHIVYIKKLIIFIDGLLSICFISFQTLITVILCQAICIYLLYHVHRDSMLALFITVTMAHIVVNPFAHFTHVSICIIFL